MSAFDPLPEELARIDWRRAEVWLLAKGWERSRVGEWVWMQRGRHAIKLPCKPRAVVEAGFALGVVALAHGLAGVELWGVLGAWQGPTVAYRGQVLIGSDGGLAVCLEGGADPLYAVQMAPGSEWDEMHADSVTAPWWLGTGVPEVES